MAYSITIKRVVPNVPDRSRLQADRFLQSAVRLAEQNQIESAHDALRQALHYELGIGPHAGKLESPILLYLQRLLDTNCRPSLVSAFATVAWAERSFCTAHVHFRRYLEINPNAPDRDYIERVLAHLDRESQRRSIPSTALDRLINWFCSLPG